MMELIEDIMKVDGVKGALLFDDHGAVLCRNRSGEDFEDPAAAPAWSSFVENLKGILGFEMLYAGGRIYIRRTREGYLLISMDDAAPMAMIRLNCDVFLHGQKKAAKRKPAGLFRSRG